MKRTERQAFTLVEILISILILGVVMSAVMTLFFSVFESYKFHQDIMEAKQRGQVAIAAIPALYLGFRPGAAESGDSFPGQLYTNGGVLKTASALLPANVTGEIYRSCPDCIKYHYRGNTVDIIVPESSILTTISGPGLWLVYAVPSGIGVENDYDIDSTGTEIELDLRSSGESVYKGNDT
jgi:prepilin-type N-terminal cleavage/methylation domain-containing protein